jgi:ubiquinone/menaquinone biosynthesis C-methylase UbiE
MKAGVQLDVFTPLSSEPMTPNMLADKIQVDSKRLEPLLYALVAADLLKLDKGFFSNTPESNKFLSKNSPQYMGPTLQFYFNVWDNIQLSPESIRAGKPMAKHDYSKLPPEKLEGLLTQLHQGTMQVGRELVEKYNFSRYNSLVDVGGGTGGLAIAVAEAHPQIEATVIELPSVLPLAKRFTSRSTVKDRVKAIASDAIHEPLPGKFDIAVAKALIHVLPEEEARLAILNIGKAVQPGGMIIIVGQILDDNKTSPMHVMAASLLFLNIYEEGRAYVEREYRRWLTEAGFKDFERGYLSDKKGIITAIKQ